MAVLCVEQNNKKEGFEMTVKGHVTSFGAGASAGAGAAVAGAALAGAALATTAVTAVSVGVGFASVGAVIAGAEFKPRSAVVGGLTSCAAIAFAAYHVGAPPAELPAEPLAAAPANTLTVEGKCADAQTRVVGKGGNVFHLILPPGCALKP